jgi:hypothetical protein
MRSDEGDTRSAGSAGILRWSGIYFGAVFGVGFLLGPIRVLWLEPRLGERAAQLIEAPFMLLATVLAGRWVGGHLRSGYGACARLAIGALAAGLVLLADLGVGVGLRGMTMAEVFGGRDPVSGAVYYALVALMALAPWALARKGGTVGRGGKP